LSYASPVHHERGFTGYPALISKRSLFV